MAYEGRLRLSGLKSELVKATLALYCTGLVPIRFASTPRPGLGELRSVSIAGFGNGTALSSI